MTDPWDTAEPFHLMNDMRKNRHEEWRETNMAVLRTASFQFRETNNGECLLFREPGKPMVDFYPSTGRWRVVGTKSSPTLSGGAEAFLVWYQSKGGAV